MWSELVALFSGVVTKVKGVVLEWFLIVAIILAFLVAAIYEANRANQAEYARDIAQSNLRAAQDTTKRLRVRGDSTVAVFQRLLHEDTVRFQTALAQVASQQHLTAKLQDSLRIVGKPETHVDTLRLDETAATRLIRDSVAGPPVDGDVTVTIPRDTTQKATVAYNLHMQPIPLSIGLGCLVDHTPSFNVVAPAWATVTVAPGQVDPSVCQPPPAPLIKTATSTTLKAVGIGGATGLLLYGLLHWIK